VLRDVRQLVCDQTVAAWSPRSIRIPREHDVVAARPCRGAEVYRGTCCGTADVDADRREIDADRRAEA
jgi:hypothetical protein